jgi:hypothetical protein
VKSDNTLVPLLFTRSLRLKVCTEAYPWLGAASMEVNDVFNYCNETSFKAATRTDLKRKSMSGFDLCNLTAGASQYFDKIGADTIQSICTHIAQKRRAACRLKLRWRVSRGARRSLGWVPFKAASVKRKGVCLRFAGKSFRVFEKERLDGIKCQGGCFSQDAVDCGESHARDVNAARNILIGSRCRTSVRGNELSSWLIPTRNADRVREAGIETAWTAV